MPSAFPQGPSDPIAVTVKDALVADQLVNEWAGGTGGLGPGPVGSRPPVGLTGAQTYKTGRIGRSGLSIPVPMEAVPSIVVAVFNRESIPDVGRIEGEAQIAITFSVESFHRAIDDDEASLDGVLRHVEGLLKDEDLDLPRHALLAENAYGMVPLVKVFLSFGLNAIGQDPDTGIYNAFQFLANYRAADWENPPLRV